MVMALWNGLQVPEWEQTGWVDHRSTPPAALWTEGNILLHIIILLLLLL